MPALNCTYLEMQRSEDENTEEREERTYWEGRSGLMTMSRRTSISVGNINNTDRHLRNSS